MLHLIVKNVLYAVNIVRLMQLNVVSVTVHLLTNDLCVGPRGYLTF